MLREKHRATGGRCNTVTPVAIRRKERNVCNTTSRLVDRRSKNRAAKLTKEIAASKGKRGTARLLRVNPGTIAHITDNTDASWKHVTLTPILMAKIELASEYVAHDAELSQDIKARIDDVMGMESDLVSAMRELRRLIRRL